MQTPQGAAPPDPGTCPVTSHTFLSLRAFGDNALSCRLGDKMQEKQEGHSWGGLWEHHALGWLGVDFQSLPGPCDGSHQKSKKTCSVTWSMEPGDCDPQLVTELGS